MALTVEDAATGATTGGQNSQTLTVNTGGTDRICVLCISNETGSSSSTSTVTSVTSAHVTWSLYKQVQSVHTQDWNVKHDLEIWIGFAATQLSSEVITVDYSATVDSSSVSFIAIAGSALTSAPFVDPNGSSYETVDNGASASVSTSISTTNADNVLVGFQFTTNRGGAPSAPTGWTSQVSQSNHSPSAIDLEWMVATKIVTSAQSSLSTTYGGGLDNNDTTIVQFAITGDNSSPSGTWASTEATDTMSASGTGQPVPPNVDATFGELTGHGHSLTSPASLSFSGTNKAAGANEYFLALIGYNLRSGADVTVSSVTVTGLTFTKLFSVDNSTSGASNNTIEVWGAPASSAFNSGGANLTYTVNWGSGQEVDDAAVCIIGIQGLNSLTQAFDNNVSLAASAFNSSNTTPPAVTFSTSLNHDLLIGLSININPFGTNEFPTAPSGWTQIASPNDNSGLAGIALGVNTKAVTSTQSSATFQDAATGNSVGWTELVLALTADPTPPPTGTMAPTEAKDTFAGAGYPQLKGTWASTDTKDTFSGFEARTLAIDTIETGGAGTPSNPPITSASVTLSTNFDEEVIVLYAVSGGHFNFNPITSVTDTAGLTWKRRNIRRIHGGAPYVEIWWAAAPTPLSADVITAHFGGAGNGACSLIALGVTGTNPASPWDLHTFAGRASDNVGSGNPTDVFYTKANNTLMLAMYASNGVDNTHTITSPFTVNANVNQAEHNGDTLYASLASAVTGVPQSNLQIQFGQTGGGFNTRFLFQDALVEWSEPSTDQPVQFFLDPGGSRTTLELTSTNESVPMTGVTFYNQDLMYICAVLIESASGLGTVTSITDSENKFSSPAFERRSRVTDPTGLIALETWYAFGSGGPPDGSDTVVIDTANTANGDTVSCVMFAVGNTTAALAVGEPFWDGSNTLPALNDSNTGGGAGVFPHVTGMSTINPHTLLLGITANLSTDEGPDATLPFFSDNPPALSLTSAGPPANIAIEFMYQPTLLSAGIATFDASPSPTTWVMIGDAIPVGLPVPPEGTWGSIETKDKLTHPGDFTSIGISSPNGWVGYVPATAAMAATDAKDKPGGAPAQAPYLSIGWLGWVPAFCTWASTDRKDSFSGGAWVIGNGITARMNGRELPDRPGFSNIGPAVTAVWHSTEFRDRFASAGFLIPEVVPPTPRKRRLLIVS